MTIQGKGGVEKAEGRSDKMVVDLGGGLKPNAAATHSVDLYRDGTDGGVVFVQHDLNSLPLPFDDGTVDRFIIDNVLEHLDIAAEALFADLLRCLRTYGTLLVIVPNTVYITYRLEYLLGIVPQDFTLAHKKHFTHRTLEYALKNAGFKVNSKRNWKSLLPLRSMLQPAVRFEAYKCPG